MSINFLPIQCNTVLFTAQHYYICCCIGVLYDGCLLKCTVMFYRYSTVGVTSSLHLHAFLHYIMLN